VQSADLRKLPTGAGKYLIISGLPGMEKILSKPRKGIILAGGAGTRLHPITLSQSKQLLPVYDKPMIYYPLATLMGAGIREFMIITTPRDSVAFRDLLGDGTQWGLSFTYAVQAEPNGIAQALIIAEEFLAGAPSALILGDNIFYGANLFSLLQSASKRSSGATVFGYYVHDPERYGVVEFGPGGQVLDLLEKPLKPPSNYAVTGIYFYDERAPQLARAMKPSARGELEITDLNREYLRKGELRVERLGRGTAWLDTGTHNSLLDAGLFVRIIEERQSLKVACVEEIAWRMGFIDAEQLERLAQPLIKSGYGEYLLRIVREPGSL
jgi:glucose-1-phosphate thymidylyltransferase